MAEKQDIVSEEAENAQGFDKIQALDGIIMPEELASLSDEDREKLGKKATFKMDIVIMPVLVIMYILNYLDRQNIASAKLANIEQDLNMSPVQYQTAVSILFCSYILFQVPSNMIASRIKWPGVYICLSMALWGAISAVMASIHNFAGLIVARIFLGAVEAVFFPGAIYFLSLFYSRKQFALRMAILYSGSQLGNAFGGLFAIGILKLDGVHGISGWRWLFLVEGVMTVGLAIFFAFILPNSKNKILGAQAAVRDPKTWLFIGILYCTYIVGAVSNFFPSVVGGLGYDRNMTYLLTAPPFLLCVITMLINGFHSDRTSERFYHVTIALCITLVANIIAVSTLNIAARYVAMMLLPGSFYASTIVTLSWITGSLSQPTAKRASAIAFINAICNTPNIWCSYLYSGGPRYVTAFAVNAAATGLAIAFAIAARIHLKRLNNKLERGEDAGRHGPTAAQVASGYRYML
uniref:Major facilitator superfamily (MFS) profile domain-containing protein n=1 Tax=Bionectria ochroleuca TaxID=29856 RepID=A0A8H7K224_BIOOC